jgi:uncharacterized membrane protein YfcA
MDYQALVIILAAVAVGSFAKGAVGIGLPIIAIPTAAAFLGVEHAIVVLTIPVFASNIWICWRYRKLATEIPNLPVALICAAAGTLAGSVLLATLSDNALIWILIVWIAAYLLNLAVNPDFRLEGKAAKIASPFLAVFAGICQGTTGIAGPVVATWIHSYRLQNEVYVFGVSIMFFAIAAAHLIGVTALGLLDTARVIQGLWMVIPTLLFVQVGMWTTRFISQAWFSRTIIAIVIVMEIKMLWQVI